MPPGITPHEGHLFAGRRCPPPHRHPDIGGGAAREVFWFALGHSVSRTVGWLRTEKAAGASGADAATLLSLLAQRLSCQRFFACEEFHAP